VEHEKFKNAAQLLYEKQQIFAHVWSKPDLSLYESEGTEGEMLVSLVDLVKVFSQVLERRKEVTKIELTHQQCTVAQMMEMLRKELLANEAGIELLAFFESCASRHAMIVAFLAVLEMVRLQAVALVQSQNFGDIRLRKHKMFDTICVEGTMAPMTEIEQQYR
jgi:segregation and condensation protein A